ncbi:MAG: hypothetical protein GXY52_04355 [Chloroflexi bacterium]|nr:hypothetical protein [Chloroflexota bacterium]
MNAREIVARTIDYQGPARLAGTMPAPYWHDFVMMSYRYPADESIWREVRPGWQERVDMWGNTWARVDLTSKGEVVRGVIEDDWAKLDTLVLPDLANPANYDEVRRICQDKAETRYRVGALPGFPFDIARYMRRLENFLGDILLEPERVNSLLTRLADLLAAMMHQYAAAGTDAVMFCEDWGTQTGLMIHPRTWRQMFKPHYMRLCTAAHREGLHVLMHSCGKITDIIPDLIEVGVDVLQFDQPRLLGLDTLAQFHGKMTFWCPVDIQKTLQTKDAAAIAAEAHELVAKLGGSQGGFIAGYYSDNVSIGLEPQWQDIACRAFSTYDRWPSA